MQKAIDLAREGDCPAAWRVVWPMAKAGDRDAFTLLAEGLAGFDMNPSGQPAEGLEWHRTYRFLVMRGYNPQSNLLGSDFLAILNSTLVEQPAGEQVADCLKDRSGIRECVALAEQFGFVPAHADFVVEVNAHRNDPNEPRCEAGGIVEEIEQ
ncbi:hypothetical protein [Martelella radicis]|uniref:Uncharacterized protein n=1 Tax=Martelella radicis TaxID=1397476 RepID=A0A7W6P961_9HYPH|nr:hypothetical protein [Martelella radicis]MBB4120204.1 hypothetical protein [Martelella radicis]